MKTEDLLALANRGFLREKEMICGTPPLATHTHWKRIRMKSNVR
jgi:hypothetical protein